jgi:hypothetical protein
MPQPSFSGNWFSTVSRALLGDNSTPRTTQLLGELSGMTDWGSERVRSRSIYSVDPEPIPTETDCGPSCGICYPVPLETRPYFDGDGRLYSPAEGTVGVSDKWFNGMSATTGDNLPPHATQGSSYPLWWDDLWYGKNSPIEDVLSAIQDRIDVVTSRTQRS